MKKYLSTGLLIILFSLGVQGQGLYSKENLEKATADELSLYLTKAQNLRRAGGSTIIVGASSILLGTLFMAMGESTAYIGYFMVFAGIGITVIGIPIRITGVSRVRETSEVWERKFSLAHIQVSPGSFYNYQTHTINPGLSLNIRF